MAPSLSYIGIESSRQLMDVWNMVLCYAQTRAAHRKDKSKFHNIIKYGST